MFGKVLTLIVIGVAAANMIAHPAGTKAFFNGIGGLWTTSVNGLLGSTTKAAA